MLREAEHLLCRVPRTDGRKEIDRKRVRHGGIAQLARAPALQAGGQRFESVYLHHEMGS